jgi:hypothetical protein
MRSESDVLKSCANATARGHGIPPIEQANRVVDNLLPEHPMRRWLVSVWWRAVSANHPSGLRRGFCRIGKPPGMSERPPRVHADQIGADPVAPARPGGLVMQEVRCIPQDDVGLRHQFGRRPEAVEVCGRQCRVGGEANPVVDLVPVVAQDP